MGRGLQPVFIRRCNDLTAVDSHGHRKLSFTIQQLVRSALDAAFAGPLHASVWKTDPVEIGFFCTQAIVQIPNALANLIHPADGV